MRIVRIDFVGGINSITGPGRGRHTQYTAKDGVWKGWTVRAEGHAVLFEGDGQRVEVPRNCCVIVWDMGPLAKMVAGAGLPAGTPILDGSSLKRRGRPPKVQEPVQE